jgi:hypothetical protein
MHACSRDHLNAPVRILDTGALPVPLSSMTEPAEPTPPPAPQTVDFCLPCVKCWYDLRGIGVRERCPECGTPVSRTMRSLFASDLGYLRRLRGDVRLACGITPAVVLSLLMLLFVAAMSGAESWLRWLHPLIWLPVPMAFTALRMRRIVQKEGRLSGRLEWPRKARDPWPWLLATVVGVAILVVSGFLIWRLEEELAEALFGVLGTWVVCVWIVRNAVMMPHLDAMRCRLGLRQGRSPWWALVTAAVVCGFASPLSFLVSQRLALVSGLALIVSLTLLLASIVMTTAAFASIGRRVGALIRFRESGGKVLARVVR